MGSDNLRTFGKKTHIHGLKEKNNTTPSYQIKIITTTYWIQMKQATLQNMPTFFAKLLLDIVTKQSHH